jgi:hypothetical protein
MSLPEFSIITDLSMLPGNLMFFFIYEYVASHTGYLPCTFKQNIGKLIFINQYDSPINPGLEFGKTKICEYYRI